MSAITIFRCRRYTKVHRNQSPLSALPSSKGLSNFYTQQTHNISPPSPSLLGIPKHPFLRLRLWPTSYSTNHAQFPPPLPLSPFYSLKSLPEKCSSGWRVGISHRRSEWNAFPIRAMRMLFFAAKGCLTLFFPRLL